MPTNRNTRTAIVPAIIAIIVLLWASFSAVDSAVAAEARIEELAQDVEFGTSDIRNEALKKLAGINTVQSSDVLGRFMMSLIDEDVGVETMDLILTELGKTPHTGFCPELIEPLCNLVGVRNPPDRDPWRREKPYAKHERRGGFPDESEIVQLIIHMEGDEVDELIVSLATGSYRYPTPKRTYLGMEEDGYGENRPHFTRAIIEAIPRLCDQERADRLMLGIVSGFYSYERHHPMDAAVYYLGENQVQGGQEVLESLLDDYDTLEVRKVIAGGIRSPWALLLSEKGHWLTATDYAYTWPLSAKKVRGIHKRQFDVFDAMIPILWALVEYESPVVVRLYAGKFKNADHVEDEDLALILCACGDMSYRSVVHDVLRSKRPESRKLAAKCMFRGDRLDHSDLVILDYVARQDQDPEVKQYVSEGLEQHIGGP